MVVSLLTGIRTEEARALRWSHVVAWIDDERRWRAVTEEVYRHRLRPVITKGAETMNTIFSQHKQAKSA